LFLVCTLKNKEKKTGTLKRMKKESNSEKKKKENL